MNSSDCKIMNCSQFFEPVTSNETTFGNGLGIDNLNNICRLDDSTQCCLCPKDLIYTASSISILNQEKDLFQIREHQKFTHTQSEQVYNSVTNQDEFGVQEGLEYGTVYKGVTINDLLAGEKTAQMGICTEKISPSISQLKLDPKSSPKIVYANSLIPSCSTEISSTHGNELVDLQNSSSSEINDEIYECNVDPSEFYCKYIYPFRSNCERPSKIKLEKYNRRRLQDRNNVNRKKSSESTIFSESQKIGFSGIIENTGEYAYKLTSDGTSKLGNKMFGNASVSTCETGFHVPTKSTCEFLLDKLSAGDSGCTLERTNNEFGSKLTSESKQETFDGGDSKSFLKNNLHSLRIRDDGIALQSGIVEEDTRNSVIKFEKRYYVVYNKEQGQPKSFWRALKNLCFFKFFRNFGSSKNIR